MPATPDRIETMRDMFLFGLKLYTWHLDENFQVLESNCPSKDFFHNILMLSSCSRTIQNTLAGIQVPMICTDPIGFVWIAEREELQAHPGAYYLLGPFFSIEASEIQIRNMCYHMKLSTPLMNEMLDQLKLMPVIHTNPAVQYAIMLHGCLTGLPIDCKDVVVKIETTEDRKKPDWNDSSWHGTWNAEMELFNRLKEGKLDNMVEMSSLFSSGNIGAMSHGNPLRQAKNEGIVLAVLCSRAAILGGVSPEGGYNLADYFILRIEAADSVAATQYCCGEMVSAFMERVRQSKKNQQYSTILAACMDYIETHMTEKISLDAMAKELGYSSYYLSSKFQKEVGISINNYINQQKVEHAKILLANHQLNAADVSERLAFSSPSYFTAIFRKYTGITPSAWQQKKSDQ